MDEASKGEAEGVATPGDGGAEAREVDSGRRAALADVAKWAVAAPVAMLLFDPKRAAAEGTGFE